MDITLKELQASIKKLLNDNKIISQFTGKPFYGIVQIHFQEGKSPYMKYEESIK